MAKAHGLVSKTLKDVGGRPRVEFRLKCQQVIVDAKGLDWAQQVLQGDKTEEVVAGNTVVKVSAPAQVRLAVLKFLAERAYGMPTQEIEVTPSSPDRDLTGEELRLRLLAAVPVLLQTLPASQDERTKLLAGIQQVEQVMEE